MKRLILAAALVAATALSANAVNLTMIQNLDLSTTLTNATANPTQYIGTNLSSLTWDGSTAYIGGANNTSGALSVGIARVSGVLSATQTYSNAFGTVSVPTTRRITSLVTNATGTQLFASLDANVGSADALRAFDTSSLPTQQWRIGDATAANDSTRRIYGAAIDPGFNGTGASAGTVAALNLGNGGRAAFNTSTGRYVTSGPNTYNFSTGMFLGSATTWRDLQFDTNGDVFARQQTNLIYGQRSGDNSFVSTPVANVATDNNGNLLPTVNNIDYQNLAIATNSPQGKFVFMNYRASTAAGQSFANVIRAFDVSQAASGTFTPEAITLSLGGFAAPANGIGAYDFSYAAINNTLAVTDFSNNRLYVFQVTAAPAVVPEAGTLPLLVLGGLTATGLIVRRRRNG
jgi:hypothetical protein